MNDHTLTVTAFEDDDVLFEQTICPRDGSCAVWHECLVEGCAPPDEDAEDEGEFVAHGVLHQRIDYDWMTRDEPYNCGAYYIQDWFDLENVGREHGLGAYSFTVDYEGDGVWTAVGFEKVAPALTPEAGS